MTKFPYKSMEHITYMQCKKYIDTLWKLRKLSKSERDEIVFHDECSGCEILENFRR